MRHAKCRHCPRAHTQGTPHTHLVAYLQHGVHKGSHQQAALACSSCCPQAHRHRVRVQGADAPYACPGGRRGTKNEATHEDEAILLYRRDALRGSVKLREKE